MEPFTTNKADYQEGGKFYCSNPDCAVAADGAIQTLDLTPEERLKDLIIHIRPGDVKSSSASSADESVYNQ